MGGSVGQLVQTTQPNSLKSCYIVQQASRRLDSCNCSSREIREKLWLLSIVTLHDTVNNVSGHVKHLLLFTSPGRLSRVRPFDFTKTSFQHLLLRASVLSLYGGHKRKCTIKGALDYYSLGLYIICESNWHSSVSKIQLESKRKGSQWLN